MKKFFNKNISIFIITFIIGLIITSPSLIPTFFLDGYCSNQIGFLNYTKYFIQSGRFLTAATYYLFEMIKISPKVVSVVSIVLSNLFLSSSVYFIYKGINKYVNSNNKKHLIYLGAFLTCYNPFILESFLFEECYAMMLSFMICIVAANTLIGESKNKYLKTFVLLFTSCFLYQSSLSIFIPYAFVLLTLKNKNYNIIKNIKDNFKTYLLGSLCYGMSLICAFLTLKIVLKIFNITSYKMGELNILKNIKSILIFINSGLRSFYNYINPYLIYAVLGIITIIIISLIITNIKKHWQKSFFIFILIIMCIGFAYVPNLAMNSLDNYAEARMLPSFGAMLGLVLLMLIIFVESNDSVSKYIYNMLCCIGILLFFTTSYIYFNTSFDGLNRYNKDLIYIKEIKKELNNYETKNEEKIDNIYFYSTMPTFYNYNAWNLYNMAFYASDWGFECGIGAAIDRDIKAYKMSEKEYKKVFEDKKNKNKNYIFNNNNMYILINK